MKTFKTEEAIVVDDMFCDICKKSLKSIADFEYSIIKANWGYGSSKDGEEWEGCFCESCSEKIDQFIESLGCKIFKSDRW